MLNINITQMAIILVLVAVVCPAAESPRELVSIIPQPVSIEYDDGYFQIGPETRIVAENEAAAEAAKLIDALAPAMGFKLSLADASQRRRGTIALGLRENLLKLGDEGYSLRVTPRRISIRAKEPVGLFYGIQTLRQLLAEQIFSKTKVEGVEWKVPCVRITDYPRFRWRGLLVDPARHFIPKQDLMRFIDVMALHKFNSLQIHLTDDQAAASEVPQPTRFARHGDR